METRPLLPEGFFDWQQPTASSHPGQKKEP